MRVALAVSIAAAVGCGGAAPNVGTRPRRASPPTPPARLANAEGVRTSPEAMGEGLEERDPMLAIVVEHMERGPEGLGLAETACGGALDRAEMPAPAAMWTTCGVVAARSNRLDVARERFERATVVDPTHAEAWLNLGALALATREWDVAATAYRSAVQVRDDDVRPWIGIARARRASGRFDEAEQAARHARTLRPDDPAAYFELGMVQLEGRGGTPDALTRAEELFRTFLRSAAGRPDLQWAVEAVGRDCRPRRHRRDRRRRIYAVDCPQPGVLWRIQMDQSGPRRALREAAAMQAEAARIQAQAEEQERRRAEEEAARAGAPAP
jgi:tetratricopeptide (TPR) repeat protein